MMTPGLLQDVRAQDLSLGGYFEHQFYPQYLGGEIALLDYNKLRVDLFADAAENLAFNADIVFQSYHGTTELNAFDFFPESVVTEYAAFIGKPAGAIREQFALPLENEIFIDNAHLTYYGPGFNARVGKQQLPWGSGYAWNPTDIFHDKNLLDPTYEKRGVNALKLEVPLGSMGMATAVFSPGESWSASTKAIRVSQYIGGFEVAAAGAWLEQGDTDYYTFVERRERRILAGGDFSGEIAGVGIWFEGAYNRHKKTADYEELLLGFDYTTRGGLYLMTELFRNGDGNTDRENYDMNDWMRLISSDGENLGRNYVLAGATYPLTELLSWSNFALLNADDMSAILYPYLVYSLNDNTELTLIGYLPVGPDGSEFGSFGAGGILRARVYF